MRYGVCLLTALVLAAAPCSAHHSFSAQYDRDDPVKLTGAVTKIEWLNPHVYFYIDVLNEETGAVENWALEMGAPAVIQRRGWARNTMKIGDLVSVEGSRARDGSRLANARTVIMVATGEELGAGSSEATAP